MARKYILFHSPLAFAVLIAGLGVMFLGLAFFAHLLRGYDFAVAFIMAILSIVTVSLSFTIEQAYLESMRIRSDDE